MGLDDGIGLVSAVLYAFVFVFGASIGSFLNVCIYRLPAGRSVVTPRSACPHCRVTIPWYDNIPVVSWFILRGRCRSCGIPFSPRYAVVEAAAGGLAVLHFARFGPSAEALFLRGEAAGLAVAAITFAFACALLVVALIDLDHQIIPNAITLPGIAAGLLASAVLPVSLRDAAIGAALGGGVLIAVAKGYLAVTGREGMGLGDVKLLAMIGAFLGWPAVLFSLLTASVTGAAVMVVVLALSRRGLRQAFPFGPFLCLAGLAYVFVGARAVAWYLSWGGF
jgi:leader peptidase (prepilin peptidase)/N-methyltransferase